MASEENIKVAVRLRPFILQNKDEVNGKAKRIVQMDELTSSVTLTNPNNRMDIHRFTFDNVLWSFDGYSEQADGYFAPENKSVSEEIYCDQKQVYEEVGKEMVQNLWNGYNSTIFTFGESKSGKSFTLLGLGANKGIIPQTLTDLFKGVREKEKVQSGFPIEVRLSMSEIYNDKVKDLLPPPMTSSTGNSTKFKPTTIKIREHSRKGFYIEGLRNVIVINHEDVQQRLEEGLINRAIFLTSVNATVGNSMTVISITLVQKIRNQRGDEATRMGTLDFIDLPACELSRANGGNFEDFGFVSSPKLRKNGVDCLAKCVDGLLEASIGKKKEAIHFDNHSVTKLMKGALTGNAKCFMVVALNPSAVAYQSSLFILKFAEKVRMLNTRPIINEEVTSKLMRELKGENEKLKKLLSLGDFETNGLSKLEQMAFSSPSERDSIKRKIVDEMKAQIKENDREIKNLQNPLEERLKPFKSEKNEVSKKIENDRKSKCHIFNLSSDSQISGKIIHIIPLGSVDFGHLTNGKGKESNNFITFTGPGIQDHHGTFTFNTKDGKFSVKPAGPNCKLFVNEIPIQFDTVLGNNDRIILGGSQVWVFQNPKESWLEKYAFEFKLHHEYILEEMALKSSHYKKLSREGVSESVQHQLVQLIPALEEAKTIGEDLNQNFLLHPVLQNEVESLFEGNSTDERDTNYSDVITEVEEDEIEKVPNILIKVQNAVDGMFSYWSTDKFYDRLELMKGSYMQYLDDGDIPLKEIEAFKESPDGEVPIGYSIICLKPLGYLMSIENSSLAILDYITFQQIGTIGFSMQLYDNSFGEKVNDSEIFLESPDELMDQSMSLVMTLHELQNVTYQFKEIYCKYKFLDEDEETTKILDSKAPAFMPSLVNKYERKITIGPITENILNLILTQFLILRFFGKQRSHKLLNLNFQSELSHYGKNLSNPVELERNAAQLKLKEKAELRLRRRMNSFKTLMEQSETLGEESIPVSLMRAMFEATNQTTVNERLEEHKELLSPIPEEDSEELPPELKALKRFSEICHIV